MSERPERPERNQGERELIEAAIPHRDPFLFVDRVVERGEDGLLGEWTVPPDADWFRGHYPGRPVTPGVLLCEHVFQCAALHIAGQADGAGGSGATARGDGVPVLTRIESARFRRVVEPGETVVTDVRVTERLGPAWYMRGRITCGGARVADLAFVVTNSGAMERASGAMG